MNRTRADENLVYNLRYRWRELCKPFTDKELVDLYNLFSISDEFGNNDERFEVWLKEEANG